MKAKVLKCDCHTRAATALANEADGVRRQVSKMLSHAQGYAFNEAAEHLALASEHLALARNALREH